MCLLFVVWTIMIIIVMLMMIEEHIMILKSSYSHDILLSSALENTLIYKCSLAKTGIIVLLFVVKMVVQVFREFCLHFQHDKY